MFSRYCYGPKIMLVVHLFLLSLFAHVSVQDWGVADYLHELDDNIVKWLKDLSTQSKKEIFEMVADYLETLQDFIEKLDLKRKNALPAGEVLHSRKGPRYLQEAFPEEKLKSEFDWRDVDIDDFKRLLKETDLLWQNFEFSFRDLKKHLENYNEADSLE